MVNDDNGDSMPALQFAEKSEQRRHLTADILIDAVETDEGVEDKQAWPELGDGFLEVCPIGVEIEAEARRGDDLDVQADQLEAGGGADSIEPTSLGVQHVFGGVEENPSRVGH